MVCILCVYSVLSVDVVCCSAHRIVESDLEELAVEVEVLQRKAMLLEQEEGLHLQHDSFGCSLC